MAWIDWLVLVGTLVFIVAYGTYNTRKNNSLKSYLKGGEMKWYTVGLSVMATQASAITFLSTPGQAYQDGMGFIQFYLGQPIALILVAVFFVPVFFRLNVYTAYQYLEERFNLNTRLFTAFLFLVSRGLAAGITIYAPAIILSTVLGWNLWMTNVIVGVLVIVYTVSGGTKAVSLTQKWQMGIILLGMFVTFFYTLHLIPVSLSESVNLAGKLGKLDMINLDFDINSRYNIWAGLTGGLFLALSYFGTDQSQVQRYLGAKSTKESKMGLMFNAFLKVPMQAFILFVGVMVFIFYQYNHSPSFFNQSGWDKALKSDQKNELLALDKQIQSLQSEKIKVNQNIKTEADYQKSNELYQKENELRADLKRKIVQVDNSVETKDTDYVFLRFILDYLPNGVIGLMLAVILCAAMSSTAGELNALATTTMIDFQQRLGKKEYSEAQQIKLSKYLTIAWGGLAIIIALSANLFENLIQLVNYLGSLFYGTILGIFLVALFIKFIKGREMFISAIMAEVMVLLVFLGNVSGYWDIGYLWFNVIGCVGVILFGILLTAFKKIASI